MPDKFEYVEVVRIKDKAIVHRIDVTGQGWRNQDKVEQGVNINLNRSVYMTVQRSYGTAQEREPIVA